MAQKQKLTEDYLEDYHPKQDTDLLVNLINHLQIAIQNKSPTLNKIKNPAGLLTSLTKLNNMVGLKYIKQSINQPKSSAIVSDSITVKLQL